MSGTLKLLHLLRMGGRPAQARLSRWQVVAEKILEMCSPLENASDDELATKGREIRWRARSGVPLDTLLPEAFALVRVMARRKLGIQHYPVQLMGGMALFEGGVAEMQTGEGKTLTAVLPAFLHALSGLGCHVITVNDYLASRDAETMGPIYEGLGLTVGCVQTPMNDDLRRDAYAQDITYGTAKEFGFDFLRDRLKRGTEAQAEASHNLFGPAGGEVKTVQRGHHFSLIDEADSILVDESRTPLIIALTQPNDSPTVNLYRWADRATHALKAGHDYIYEPDKRYAYLTDAGCRRVLLLKKPALIDTVTMPRIYEQVEKALIARHGFQRDRDYVIHNNEVVIVDESTGRMMEGRKWQDGLHQAIEAKELVPITAAGGQAARITLQSYFRHYEHLAGMTGTAAQVSRELYRTFGVRVTVIPTHRPCIRQGLPPRFFRTLHEKQLAIVEEIGKLSLAGRAVLVGTPSVERSEMLGEMLKARGIEYQILNARFHKQEAEIVSHAGETQRVTIATNMAGRGTDILLDEIVRRQGGLHVLATEMHSSARIDRQLVGRAARQGDPGTFQFFLSLEDELLRCLPFAKVKRLRDEAAANAQGELTANWLGFFRRTQRFLERQHRKQRKELLRAEKFRTELYEKMGLDPYLEMTD